MTYEVACVCGEVIRGQRQRQHQVACCPTCGRAVFVLPASPYALQQAQQQQQTGGTQSPWWRAWRTPLAAGGACLVLLAGGIAALLPHLSRHPGEASEKAVAEPAVADRVRAGRQALAQGHFRLALRELNLAVAQRDASPTALGARQSRELNQLQRQADLLARLSPLSLEEIVRHGKLVRNRAEWEEQFNDLHRGRTVVFDDVVRRDAEGRPALANHVIEEAGEVVRLALESLSLFHDMPLLDEGVRVIFGARLAGCGREEGGAWVVRFEPSSGVLLTDLAALEQCLPGGADDEMRSALQRQQRWLDERVVLPPARP